MLPPPPAPIFARAAALADTPGFPGDARFVLSGELLSPLPLLFGGFWGVPSRLGPELPPSPALAAMAGRRCLCAVPRVLHMPAVQPQNPAQTQRATVDDVLCSASSKVFCT